MKKCWVLLIVLCMLFGTMTVHAENYYIKDTIPYGETITISVPRPEGQIEEGWVYFTQEFTFVPEVDGTYRFLVRYKDDEADPYDIFMDVAGEYRQIPNGCEFDGKAGETYELCFQYPNHDGRYPEFTFYVTSNDVHEVPKTGDAGLLPPLFAFVLSGAGLVLLAASKKRYA